VIFWAHLATGVLVGLVVILMSATGVLLTFERQILRSIDDGMATSDKPAQSADRLIEATSSAAGMGAETMVSLRFSSEPGTPIAARIGRSHQYLLDPGTGAVLREGPSEAAAFFQTVTRMHRWFALEGNARAAGRAITGWSNLGFLFLLTSGIYLWLPRIWNSTIVRARILLKRRYATPKARDWAWHHVFSFWAALPLFFIITTATVFYFPWANAMVYGAFGESPPDRGGSDNRPVVPGSRGEENRVQGLVDQGLALAELRGLNWKTLTVRASLEKNTPVELAFDASLGGQPQSATSLTLNTDQVARWSTLEDRTPGARARTIVRFLHTGEVLGPAGQTIAGLASLAACVLVWTGLALAWRRLARPILLRRTSSRKSPI
jgi:uncharacterized iron-regulated membrane protein